MKVAGFGFRKGAGVESLRAALDATGTAHVDAIATVEAKADAACLTDLARALAVPVCAVAKANLAGVVVDTQSDKSMRMFGTGSLSEAAALVAAGSGARLTVSRRISPDSMATCAIAESEAV